MKKEFWNSNFFIFSFYILLCGIIYAQTYNFGFSIDDDLIKQGIEGQIFQFSDIFDVFKQRYNRVDYRPISMLTFALEYLYFGAINPNIAHTVNVFLFIVIVLSIHRFLTLLLGKQFSLEIFFIVALFATHPLCVEAVSNIKSRDGLISMLCGIWSLYYFIKANQKHYSLKFYFLSWIFFLIGLFSKIDILGLLFFIIGYHFIQFNKKSWLRGVILFFVFFFTYVLFRENLVNHFLPIETNTTSTLAVTTFTENPLSDLSGLTSSFIGFFQTIFIYLSKIIFPKDLLYYYGFNYYHLDTSISLKIILLLFLFIGLIFTVLYFSKKNKFILLTAIGFLSYILFATNFFTPVAGIVADRYAFMSLFWFWALFVLILTIYLPLEKTYTKLILGSIIIVFTFISFSRVKAWKDLLTLIETDAPKLHDSYEGMRIASSVFYDNYNKTNDTTYLDKAIDCALQAVSIYPENLLINTQLGQYYFRKNNIPLAEKYLLQAATVDTTNAILYQYLGDVYYTKKNYNQTVLYYNKSLKLADYLQRQALINNISTVYYEQDKEKALAYNLNLIKTDSTDFAAYENLGYYYLNERDTIASKKYFDLAKKFGMPGR